MKKSLSILMVLTMVLTMLPAGLVTASALTSGDYTYTVTNFKATITKYNGTGTNITIPGTLGGYPVTEIGEIAFSNNDTLVSVVFPDSLISIGASAFSFCDALKQVSIPNSVVSIGENAFNWCTVMTSVSIGSGLATLGIDAFTNCTILTQILVDAQNKNFSTRDGVLFNKDQTTLICYPQGISGVYIIPVGVQTIAENAFFHCHKLTSIFFPGSLINIGIRAFYNCDGITSITLSNNLTAVGLHAFNFCYKLISAYFLGNAPVAEAGVFSNCATGFTVYRLSDKTGFSNAPWNTYTTAIFTMPGEYTITFDANGGTGGTSALMTSGTALIAPVVSKPGYAFTGWLPAVPVSVPEVNTTYVAQWRETNPTITFDSNGGSETAAITQVYNTPVEKPADPLKDGFTFGGWFMDQALTTPVIWPFTVTQSIVFYAGWNAENCYTIIFNAGGGNGGTIVAMPAGDPLAAPQVIRTGYTLAGWTPALPPAVPTANTVYTAQWSANTYSVNYNGNNNDSGSTANSTHTYDISANLTSNGFTKTGNTFLGWSTDSGAAAATYANSQSVVNLTPNQGEVITFFAVWSVNHYTITFSANGGTGGTSSSMLYGAALTPPTVTKMNYTFSSWSPAVPATVPAANTTYTAQWAGVQFTVTFDPQGGTVSPETSTVTYAKTYGAGTGGFPTPTRNFYTFGGWYTGTGGTGTKISSTTTVTTTAPQTLYAKWTAFTYTVAYNGNGSTGGSTANTSHSYYTAKALRANGFTKTGYAFIGWATSPEGDVVYSDGQSVINLSQTNGATVTLYAKWNDINAHLIIFNANGGTGGTSSTLIAGSPLAAPAVARTGYTLTGWSPEVPATVPLADTVYVAQWSINSYTITFDEGYGTGYADPVTQNYNTSVNLPTTGFSRTNYTFIGWNTEPDATTALSSFTVPAYNETLFAVYTLNYYSLTLKLNDGTNNNYQSFSLPAETRVYYGYYYFEPNDPYDPGYPRIVPVSPWDPTPIIPPYDPYDPWYNYDPDLYYITIEYPYFVPPPMYGPCGTTESYGYIPPARAGYDFVGWSESPTGTATTSYTLMQTENKTLYAVWTEHVPDYVTITFDANGGSGSMSPIEATGGSVTLPHCTFTRTNYTFIGWATSANGSAIYVDGDTITVSSSLTLYAVWQPVAADYSAVDAAIVLANAATLAANLNKDPKYTAPVGSLYLSENLSITYPGGKYPRAFFTSASLNTLLQKVNEVVRGYDITKQSEVNDFAINIMMAYNNLELKPADYTHLRDLMNQADTLDREIYTEDSLAAVDEVMLDAQVTVDANYKMPLKDLVDDTAAMLDFVLDSLVYLPADYTGVTNAWNSKPADSTNYTADSVAALEDFYYQEIDWNLTIEYQDIVDSYAAHIYALISALVFKSVTYTVKYQTSAGVTLLAQIIKNAHVADWITEYAPAITGYTPVQASIQQQLTGTSSENVITFTYIPITCTITWNPNGGTGGVTTTTQNPGTTIVLPADPTKTGYMFAGWYFDSALTTPLVMPYILTGDITLYARWTASTVHFTVSSVSGMTGDTVTVTVSVSENSSLGAITLVVPYDSSVLEVIGYSAGSILNGFALDVNNNETALTITLAAARTTQLTAGGSILDIQFRIKGSAPTGTISTGAYISELTDTATPANALPFDITQGSITVVCKLGDINGSGTVTAVDALMVLQAATGRITLTAEQLLAADVNKSGTVTALDALMILQYATGKITSF